MNKITKNKDFLQSEEWRKFQEATGKRTFLISSQKSPSSPPFEKGEDLFWASIIEHKLPIVGRYFYIPKGPIFNFQFSIFNQAPISDDQIKDFFSELINLAKKKKAGWIRFDAENKEVLNLIKNNLLGHQMSKSPHNMQPREAFVIDIIKPEEELLKEMKEKTRYNIKLAQKREVFVKVISSDEKFEYYFNEFIRLVKLTSKRQRIVPHAEYYYRKMFEAISPEIIKLYVAEHQGKIIAANIVIFYGGTATYLHGASDNEYRNVMAPYLLQWKQICDARAMGCGKYDFGGVKTEISNFYPEPAGSISNKIPISKDQNSNNIPNARYQMPDTNWSGITKFKIGFSPNTKATEFLGSYDIVISPRKYYAYRVLQKIKRLAYFLLLNALLNIFSNTFTLPFLA